MTVSYAVKQHNNYRLLNVAGYQNKNRLPSWLPWKIKITEKNADELKIDSDQNTIIKH